MLLFLFSDNIFCTHGITLMYLSMVSNGYLKLVCLISSLPKYLHTNEQYYLAHYLQKSIIINKRFKIVY